MTRLVAALVDGLLARRRRRRRPHPHRRDGGHLTPQEQPMTDIDIRPGDIWRDLDPRGGPIFRVVEGPTELTPHAVWVEALDGKRQRYVLLKRFRDAMWHDTDYRYGYGLYVRREEVVQ